MPSNFYSWVKDERILKNPNAKCSSPHPESCPYHGTKQLDKTDAENKDAGRGGDDVAQMDAAYADAVKRGDRETALKMIRQAAAKAFPNTKVVDKDGLPKIVWHGGTFNRKGNYKAKGAMHFGTIGAALERICGEISGYVDKDSDGNYYSYDGNDEKITGTPHSVKIDAYKELAKTSDITVHPYLLNIENPAWTDDRVEDPEFDEEQGIKSRIADKTYENDGFDGNEYVNNIEDAGSTSWVAYSPNQIKSADITYDDDGNLIPLSKRFDSGDDIRGDVSKKNDSLLPADDAEMDREYLDAVKRGDMEMCAKMVRASAAKALPNTKAVDEDGLPRVYTHSTDSDFTSFKTPWVYFSKEKVPDPDYGIKALSIFVNIENPIPLEDDTYVLIGGKRAKGRSPIDGRTEDIDIGTLHYNGDVIQQLVDMGYDGMLGGRQFYNVSFRPRNQIKSADPITYADDGSVIPLSKRFNLNNPDIRY